MVCNRKKSTEVTKVNFALLMADAKQENLQELKVPYNVTVTNHVNIKLKNQVTLYELTVNCDAFKWKILKTFNEISELHNNIMKSFNDDNIVIRDFKFISSNGISGFFSMLSGTDFIKERKKELNKYFERLFKLNEFMLNKNKNINNKRCDIIEEFLRIDIFHACVIGDINLVKYLLNKKKYYDINIKDKYIGSSIFHFLISHQQKDLIEYLFNNDKYKDIISFDNTDMYGWNILNLCKYFKDKDNNNDSEYGNIYDIIIEKAKKVNIKMDDPLFNYPENVVIPIQYKFNVYQSKRNILVIVNPKSGPGNSEAYWKNGIQILLNYTKLFDYKVVITQKQYHGTEICEQLNPSTYDYIVVLGGDGTASEVYNGLNQNNNKNALNIPVLCLPTGSGNAMAAELKAENTKNFLLDAIRNIIYGYSVYIDAYAAKQKNQKDTLGFISTQWGVMAVIDFESEKFRFMGM